MIWSTSKTFIKNFIEECYDAEELETLVDEASVKAYAEQVSEALWHEGYITLDYSKWNTKDFEKIITAAKAQLAYISEEE